MSATSSTQGYVRGIWSRLLRNKMAMIALGYLVVLAGVAILAPIIAPHDPIEQNIVDAFASPSREYWLGTDDLGRDVFSRLLHGAQLSLWFSIRVVLLAAAVALPLGLLAGYLGGTTDFIVMRAMDAVLSFPALVLAIAIVAIFGPSLQNTILAIAVVVIPAFTRLVRGQALAVREEAFVEVSRAIGSSQLRIVAQRLLPNVLSPLLVHATTVLGIAVIAEAALSFLGLGARPPNPSLGSMLRRSYDQILIAPWDMMIPGAAIALTVLAFNTLGDGLRDALRAGGSHSEGQGIGGASRVDHVRDRAAEIAALPSAELLQVQDLHVALERGRDRQPILDGLSLTLAPGETLGLVGESGSGKSLTALSIMRLAPSPPMVITGGSVRFDGRDLLTLSVKELARLRGRELSMVFQDPTASLNPSRTIESQVAEVIRWHDGASAKSARKRAAETLDLVQLPRSRAASYPHEFSGGMRQRAVMAIALACRPRLLIADEPTSALDVTIQAQILALIAELRDELGMAMLLVTHDLGVVADMCDRVTVMYAGQIVEQAPVDEVFDRPLHPYTEGLLRAIPQQGRPGEPLEPIPGQVPELTQLGETCRLVDRCPYAEQRCRQEPDELRVVDRQRWARCLFAGSLELRGADEVIVGGIDAPE